MIDTSINLVITNKEFNKSYDVRAEFYAWSRKFCKEWDWAFIHLDSNGKWTDRPIPNTQTTNAIVFEDENDATVFILKFGGGLVENSKISKWLEKR